MADKWLTLVSAFLVELAVPLRIQPCAAASSASRRLTRISHTSSQNQSHVTGCRSWAVGMAAQALPKVPFFSAACLQHINPGQTLRAKCWCCLPACRCGCSWVRCLSALSLLCQAWHSRCSPTLRSPRRCGVATWMPSHRCVCVHVLACAANKLKPSATASASKPACAASTVLLEKMRLPQPRQALEAKAFMGSWCECACARSCVYVVYMCVCARACTLRCAFELEIKLNCMYLLLCHVRRVCQQKGMRCPSQMLWWLGPWCCL